MTTPEEYAGQRYEAASTIFGPNTLNAYLQQYEMLMGALLGGGGVRELQFLTSATFSLFFNSFPSSV